MSIGYNFSRGTFSLSSTNCETMSTTKQVVTIKDVITFTLNEADLTTKKVGDKLTTPKCEASCSGGLKYWVECYPAGENEANKDHVSVFLWVNMPVKASYTFAVYGSSIEKSSTEDFDLPVLNWGFSRLASHEELRPLFSDGKLTISCNVEFDVSKPVPLSIPRNFQLLHHLTTDVELIAGSNQIPVHKNFLSMISPVFHAMFSTDSAESKSGRVEITDFDFDTVKASMDLCYGRELSHPSVDIVVNVLRFCDKYFINALDELDKMPLLKPSIASFCPIIQYAYDCNRKDLMTDCLQFFNDNQDEVRGMKEFADLPPNLVVAVLKSVF